MKILTKIIIVSCLVLACCLCAGCISTDNPKLPVENKMNFYSGGDTIDYTDKTNWMKFEENPQKDVDLIFIYPTCVYYSAKDQYISNIDEGMKKDANADYNVMGTAFSDYANVYAPYYRQIPFDKIIMLNSYDEILDAFRNCDGKTDLFSALDYYFENVNNGRPYIIAGHSQGGAMILVILEEYMKKHPDYYKRMIVAYPLGFGVNQKYFDKNPHLKFATGETDTGVIVDYNVEGPNGTQTNFLIPENALNINPLNWKTDETYASEELNKYEPISKYSVKSDAQINKKRGVVVSTVNTNYPTDASALKLFGNKSLHGAEFFDYFGNLKENGKKRIEAYFANQKDY